MVNRTLKLLLGFAASIAALTGCSEPLPPVAVGTLERHRIELRAERSEPLLRLAVVEGDAVQAGDVVAELDRRRSAARLDQANSARDGSQARLAEALRGSRVEDVNQGRAELAEAESALVERQLGLARIKSLVTEGIESQAALDAATVARREALRAALEPA